MTNHSKWNPAAKLVVLLVGAACLTPATRLLAEEHWNQYLGPTGNGHSSAKGLPLEWNEKSNIRWKVPIRGKGWSSPTVWGNRAWLTTATEDGTKMYVLCIDCKTGKTLHDLLVLENEKPEFCHKFNSYASPTPFVEQGRVYAHFGKYGTMCLDAVTGKKIWERRDFKCDHYRGPGASPIIHGDLLFVAFDGFDVQYVVALDKATGKTVWKKQREIDYGDNQNNGDRKKAYGTALIVDVGGKPLLISPSAGATIAYNPSDGREIWRCNHGGWNASLRPVHYKGSVFLNTHSGGLGTLSLRCDGRGDVTKTHVGWTLDKGGRQLPNPLLIGDLLYLVDSLGVATCLEAATGKVVWKERLGGNFVASPIYADGRIYAFNREGAAHVFAPGREFRRLAENKLSEGCMATPAVVGDSLIARTITHLYCIGK
ncbi:MAG: PQQ-binding-like beta-propeller repeat protein [Planctomycetales bacterium]